MLLGAALLLSATQAQRARAFSQPDLYAESVTMGGGGGRWFTGSSADGYGCDVCHTGGTAQDLAITGLPLDGFTPGGHYEITIGWPAATQLALVAEFTDEQRHGVGLLELPQPLTTAMAERCSEEEGGGGLPTALHEAEGGRTLFSVIDCGAQLARFRWTAPSAVAGPVWFNLGFVAANEDAAPSGDGVTLVRRSLQTMGAALETRVVAQGCTVLPGTGSHGGGFSWMLGLGVGWLLRRRRGTEVS
jgi:uncharacterized protein (TIGR03382 family)